MITLYTKQNCVQCVATKKVLDAHNAKYTTVEVDDAPDTVAALRSAGHMSLPVVQTDTCSWSGFRPDLIKEAASG